MIVVIDGNIGSGKSTQVEMLKDLYTVHREPLDQWGNLLKWFYADPKRWALTFQMKVLKCFNALKDDPATTTIVERYPESSRCVFWKLLCEEGTVLPEEQDIYNNYYTTYTPDILIYLRCPPEKCVERFRNRGQPGDDTVELAYVKTLHRLYEDMYDEKEGVHILDATLEPAVLHKHIKDIISKTL